MQTNLRPENVQLFYFVILKIESFQCELPSVNYVKQKKRTVLQDSSCVLPRFRVHDRVFFLSGPGLHKLSYSKMIQNSLENRRRSKIKQF